MECFGCPRSLAFTLHRPNLPLFSNFRIIIPSLPHVQSHGWKNSGKCATIMLFSVFIIAEMPVNTKKMLNSTFFFFFEKLFALWGFFTLLICLILVFLALHWLADALSVKILSNLKATASLLFIQKSNFKQMNQTKSKTKQIIAGKSKKCLF